MLLANMVFAGMTSLADNDQWVGRARNRTNISGVTGHRGRVLRELGLLTAGLVLGVVVGGMVSTAHGQTFRSDEDAPGAAARAELAIDPLLEIREHFNRALPPGWWASEPEPFLSGYQVTVNIPSNWAGNPRSAMMDLCPPRQSPIWRSTDRVFIEPRYHNLSTAGFECRL